MLQIAVSHIKTHWKSLRDQYRIIFNDESVQGADIDPMVIENAKKHKKMFMEECAFLNDLFRGKRQNGAKNNDNSQTEDSSHDSEVLTTVDLNTKSEEIVGAHSSGSLNLLNADDETQINDHQYHLYDPNEESLQEIIDTSLFQDGIDQIDRQVILDDIDSVATGERPIMDLQKIARLPLVKQAAGYVMDAAMLLEQVESYSQNFMKKAVPFSKPTINASIAISNPGFMDETKLITDIILAIKEGPRRAAALRKVIQIGMTHNEK